MTRPSTASDLRKRLTSNPIENWVAAAYFGLSLTWTASLFFSRPMEAWRWLQNDPGTGVFVVFIVPVIAFLLARNLREFKSPWDASRRTHRNVALAVLLALSVCLAWLIGDDFKRSTATPCYFFETSISGKDACKSDQEIREQSVKPYLARNASLESAAGDSAATKQLQSAIDNYKRLWSLTDKQSGGIKWNDLTTLPRIGVVVNYMVALLAVVMIWHCQSFHWASTAPLKFVERAIGLLFLFSLWVPLRIYSVTYINFFDPRYTLGSYFPIIAVGVMLTVMSASLFLAYVKSFSRDLASLLGAFLFAGSSLLAAKYDNERDSVVGCRLAIWPSACAVLVSVGACYPFADSVVI